MAISNLTITIDSSQIIKDIKLLKRRISSSSLTKKDDEIDEFLKKICSCVGTFEVVNQPKGCHVIKTAFTGNYERIVDEFLMQKNEC